MLHGWAAHAASSPTGTAALVGCLETYNSMPASHHIPAQGHTVLDPAAMRGAVWCTARQLRRPLGSARKVRHTPFGLSCWLGPPTTRKSLRWMLPSTLADTACCAWRPGSRAKPICSKGIVTIDRCAYQGSHGRGQVLSCMALGHDTGLSVALLLSLHIACQQSLHCCRTGCHARCWWSALCIIAA